MGKIIVFEGLSAAGKATQSKLLLDFLEKKTKTKTMAFPTYQATEFGVLVARYLKGEFGAKEDLPEFASLLYSLDRYQFKKEIENYLKEDYYLVFDRYTTSNLAYQSAFFEGEKKQELIEWMKIVDSRMPKPDAVVFLDVPRSFTEQLILQRNQKNSLTKKDIHETDRDYEEKVRETYLQEAKKQGWIIIDCVQDNEMKSREEIHANVLSALRNKNVLP
ncbi:dTMP kinase [Candidatus Micrarchaeota archaeon]|nr:dTMP kinase [Candidatus Micrarchaeota archaeon]